MASIRSTQSNAGCWLRPIQVDQTAECLRSGGPFGVGRQQRVQQLSAFGDGMNRLAEAARLVLAGGIRMGRAGCARAPPSGGPAGGRVPCACSWRPRGPPAAGTRPRPGHRRGRRRTVRRRAGLPGDLARRYGIMNEFLRGGGVAAALGGACGEQHDRRPFAAGSRGGGECGERLHEVGTLGGAALDLVREIAGRGLQRGQVAERLRGPARWRTRGAGRAPPCRLRRRRGRGHVSAAGCQGSARTATDPPKVSRPLARSTWPIGGSGGVKKAASSRSRPRRMSGSGANG